MTGICTRCGFEIENDAEQFDACPRCGDLRPRAAVVTIRGNREHLPDFVPMSERIADPFTPKRREQDIYLLKNPQHWPSHMLALKKYNLIDNQLLTAVWDGTTLHVGAIIIAGQLIQQASEQIVATPEQVVEMGWTVD